MRIMVCIGMHKNGQWDLKYPDNWRNEPIIQAWQRWGAKHPEHELVGYDNVSPNPPGDFDIIIQWENHKHRYNPHIISSKNHYKNAYKVFYVQDTVRYPDIHKHIAKHFNMVFCSQRNAYEVLKDHPNRKFHIMGIDPYKIFKIDKFPKMYDLGLISGMKDYKYRSSYLDCCKDFATSVFWNGINPNDQGYFYNLLKIGVNLSTRGTWDMVAYRTLEVMGSGTFLITNRLNKGVMEELYEEDVHYVAFDDGNYDEFRDKVKYYLSHDEEREKIAHAGYELVQSKYTWDAQVEAVANEAIEGVRFK